MINDMKPGNTISHYRFSFQLGCGSSSEVWHAIDELTNTSVAIKIVKKSLLASPKEITQFQREIAILKKLGHPHIAEFYEVFDDKENYYIVMELIAKGNLLEQVNENGCCSEDRARRIFAQLISVIEYLHIDCHIAHRDLKCENILIDSSNDIKVIDFGLSNIFTSSLPYFNTCCGSPAYASPELIKGQKYTQSTDIWSLGVILFAIVVGSLPFDDKDVSKLLEKIVFSEVFYPRNISPQLEDLLSKMLEKSPEHRISLDKIKEHPWFSLSEYSEVTNQYRKFDLINFNDFSEREIDYEIIRDMEKMGIDIENLRVSLLTGEFTRNTAAYRILKRRKENRIIKSIISPNNSQKNAQKQQFVELTRISPRKEDLVDKNCFLVFKANTLVPKIHDRYQFMLNQKRMPLVTPFRKKGIFNQCATTRRSSK